MNRHTRALLLVTELPPDQRDQFEGVHPDVLDVMTLQDALLRKQQTLIAEGADPVPSLAEIADTHFAHLLTPTHL